MACFSLTRAFLSRSRAPQLLRRPSPSVSRRSIVVGSNLPAFDPSKPLSRRGGARVDSLPPEKLHCEVLEPMSHHDATVIWLHGLGDSGTTYLQPMSLLQRRLSNVKFVMPHAPPRRITAHGGGVMPAWSDVYELGPLVEDFTERVDRRGLESSRRSVQKLIAHELSLGISPRKIIVGGFSHGAALALALAYRRHELPLGGVVCISGFLPLPVREVFVKNDEEWLSMLLKSSRRARTLRRDLNTGSTKRLPRWFDDPEIDARVDELMEAADALEARKLAASSSASSSSNGSSTSSNGNSNNNATTATSAASSDSSTAVAHSSNEVADVQPLTDLELTAQILMEEAKEELEAAGFVLNKPPPVTPNGAALATPALVMHGRDDDVVPFHHCELSVERLRSVGVTVETDYFRRLGHELCLEGLQRAGKFIAQCVERANIEPQPASR